MLCLVFRQHLTIGPSTIDKLCITECNHFHDNKFLCIVIKSMYTISFSYDYNTHVGIQLTNKTTSLNEKQKTKMKTLNSQGL